MLFIKNERALFLYAIMVLEVLILWGVNAWQFEYFIL